jgi:DNA-binding beta-propeller fold protein YncE
VNPRVLGGLGLLLVLGLAAVGLGLFAVGSRTETSPTELFGVGPRHVSNETTYPLTLYGRGFTEGMTLLVEGPTRALLQTTLVDERHLVVRLPTLEVPENVSQRSFTLTLIGDDGKPVGEPTTIDVVNDAAYRLPYDLQIDRAGTRVFVASPSTDEILVADVGGEFSVIPVGDRPQALSRWVDEKGTEWLVVAYAHARRLSLLSMRDPKTRSRTIPIPTGGQGLAVHGRRAYVSNRVLEALLVVDLVDERLVGSHPTGVDPGPVVVHDGVAWVGNLGSTDLSRIDLGSGQTLRLAASSSVAIVGGHTERYQPYVMGSSAPRDLVVSPSRRHLFVADVGPVIGPNPDRMEVSMNGGVGVVDFDGGIYRRHVSIRRGVPQGLALDDARGVLYAADIATGRVVALGVDALVKGDDAARSAQLAEVEIQPPDDTRLIREREEFSVEGRSSIALHSGPRVLRLTADGQRGFLLNRFTGVVSQLDLTRVEEGTIGVQPVLRVPRMHTQARRRFGEVVYTTDLSNHRMSCDACHYEGHSSGVLFTKGEPMHIYRTPTIRSARETPPYFTPAMIPSLLVTAQFVLSRNRFHNPDASGREARALAEYQDTLVQPPNPFRDEHGGWAASLNLPSGAAGSPTRGMALFEGKGACVDCHPPPHFATDQDPATRGRRFDVGTSVSLPLRTEMQDSDPYPLPAPSLVGAWTNYPLLHSGAGGYGVVGNRVLATADFALGRVLELGRASRAHGAMHELSEQEQNDLLAYLMTL